MLNQLPLRNLLQFHNGFGKRHKKANACEEHHYILTKIDKIWNNSLLDKCTKNSVTKKRNNLSFRNIKKHLLKNHTDKENKLTLSIQVADFTMIL